MKIIKAPHKFDKKASEASIFLAGSIEMGEAELWQKKFHDRFSKHESCVLLDPRRDDWNSFAEQSIKDKYFAEQVNWEQDMLETADIIALYFAPNTKSPISLLELGLFADSGRLIACCPDGFWRKGNVEIVCKRYNIELFNDFDEFINKIEQSYLSLLK